MYIIGISAFYHDSSVCLFKDNRLIFACEEEKFSGIKHDSSFPQKTLDHIFKKFNLNSKNIQAVCYYENPKLKRDRVILNIKKNFFKNPLFCLKSLFKITNIINDVDERLKKISPNVFYSDHHQSHLYYSFYTSPFHESACLSVDGVGEIDTLSFGIGGYKGISYTTLAKYPHSLGLYYTAMTTFLGFKPNEGEYKMMGLASYGNPETYYEKVKELIQFKNGKLLCNMDVFCWDRSDTIMFNEKLEDILGIGARITKDPIDKIHEDLAASVQKVYEDVLFDIIKSLRNVTDNTNLSLSGGCAYNGTANGKITQKTQFNRLWIPPAPSDAGSSIGAVVHYLVDKKKFCDKISRNPFLGPNFSENEIYDAIKKFKYKKFKDIDEVIQNIVKPLNDGKVIGWFQGHIEFGARALGNRSILANPTLDGMKDKINKVIKKREGFRPFAPMVIKDKQNIYFHMTDDVPYMNQVVRVKDEYKEKLKAVTHVDGTARVQTVQNHTVIHKLLLEFEKISGYPVLLNTSFNVKDKTMVLTPKDAVETFYDTEMDILVMDKFAIYK